MNETDYIDNKRLVKVVDVIAPAIQNVPLIRDHPDWWSLLTYDGSKSHVKISEALQTFHYNKIRVEKEESGRSHVNQLYDHDQVKADKRASG